MVRRRSTLLIVLAVAIFMFGGAISCKRPTDRSIREAATAVPVGTDSISIRLNAFSEQQGGSPADCGKTSIKTPDASVARCVQAAFRRHSPFTAQYITDDVFFTYAYGIAGDSAGKVVEGTYNSRGFPSVPPSKRTQLLDNNRVRLTLCAEPIDLGVDGDGVVGCVTPVNEEASVIRQAKPIETTICAIAENPAAFNNKLVRVKGHYSGNFEYSMLSGDGCPESLWFEYASDNDSPPGLVIHVSGGALPGGEDEKGWRIRPLPVSLVQDKNFEHFERLMKARVKAEQWGEKRHPGRFVSYQVTATFTGRIDGVSREIREFHRKRSPLDSADFLGFGQMGLFDAQLIMQSVEGDAVLESEPRSREHCRKNKHSALGTIRYGALGIKTEGKRIKDGFLVKLVSSTPDDILRILGILPGSAGERALAAGATAVPIPKGSTTIPGSLNQFEPRPYPY
jgi:hypothetical protein